MFDHLGVIVVGPGRLARVLAPRSLGLPPQFIAGPNPFLTVDRRATAAPFAAMEQSGWRARNTLGKYYFHHETNVLNEAGERKLYSIISNSPEQHNAVYVVRSIDPNQVRCNDLIRFSKHWLA